MERKTKPTKPSPRKLGHRSNLCTCGAAEELHSLEDHDYWDTVEWWDDSVDLALLEKMRAANRELLERLRGKRVLRWEQVLNLCPVHGEPLTLKRRSR